MKKRAFVSYTMRESGDVVGRLINAEKVVGAHFHVFIDLLHNRASNKQAEVIRQLLISEYVVLMISPNYFESPWVRFEVSTAIRLQKKIYFFPQISPSSAWDSKREKKRVPTSLHRVIGGSHPPPIDRVRSVRISRTTRIVKYP